MSKIQDLSSDTYKAKVLFEPKAHTSFHILYRLWNCNHAGFINGSVCSWWAIFPSSFPCNSNFAQALFVKALQCSPRPRLRITFSIQCKRTFTHGGKHENFLSVRRHAPYNPSSNAMCFENNQKKELTEKLLEIVLRL